MPRLFIPQDWVDNALANDAALLDGETLFLRSDQKKYRILPAFVFLAVEGGDADAHRLVGKVKTEEQLVALGAELMSKSAILGETAYRVQPGFTAEPLFPGNPVATAFLS